MLVTLLKKTDYSTKVTEIHDKYIDTQEFNKLAGDVFNARLAQANLKQKQILMINYQILTERLLKIKQIIYLFKMN